MKFFQDGIVSFFTHQSHQYPLRYNNCYVTIDVIVKLRHVTSWTELRND